MVERNIVVGDVFFSLAPLQYITRQFLKKFNIFKNLILSLEKSGGPATPACPMAALKLT